MSELYIEWPNGRMEVCLNAFFPTTKANVKKLLGTIELDDLPRDELIAQLEQYFREKILECELAKMKFAQQAARYEQAADLAKERIESGVSVTGTPLSDTELKLEKDGRKHAVRVAKESLAISKQYGTLFGQFMGYLEMLSKRKERK